MLPVRSCPGGFTSAQVLLVCAVLTFGCSPGSGRVPAATDPGPSAIPVIATYSIVGDWVQRVGGDEVKVTVLVGPGGDAHTYEPTPRDSVALEQARIIFENGLGFEVWLDRLCTSSRTSARRCVVTRDIAPRAITSASGRDEVDPHVWQSPANAMQMVGAIADDLAAADPFHAAQCQ